MLEIHTLRIDGMRRPQYVRRDFQFSWVLERDTANCVQQSYEITLWLGAVCIWSSGRQISEQCFAVPYTGPVLAPVETYRWRVTCWDRDANCAWAEDTFRTCRDKRPWNTGWIQPVQQPAISERPFPFGGKAVPLPRNYNEFRPTQLVRRCFHLKKPIKKAIVHVSAHGCYRLEINGQPFDTPLLAPDCEPYDKLIFFQTYNITDQLIAGENVIGAEIADGWWISRLGLGSWSCQYGNKTALLLCCEITYADGSTEYFGGENARSHVGPTRYADLYVGECHDAAAIVRGWSSPNFDDSSWCPVESLEIPLDNLEPQMGEGIEIVERRPPASIFQTPNGEWVLDAGQTVAGFLRLHVETEAGVKIVLEHSEMLRKDGNFFQNIIGSNKDQTDVYYTRNGRQSWHPSFTYHGFRYVRITGWPGIPQKEHFEVCVISSEKETIGEFSCSDERLNQLHRNIRWSQRANTIGIPTDCPQREKAGWTGDIAMYAPTMLCLAPAEAFLRRWMRYLREEQFENGLVPSVVPYWGVFREVSRILGSNTSCGWGDAVLLVPWAVYQETGNDRILRENYDAMQRWMAYVRVRAEQGRPDGYEHFDAARRQRQPYLWNTDFHFGDWLLPSIMMAGGTPQDTARLTGEIFGSAYYAHANQIMVQICRVLGKQAESDSYSARYQKIREAFIGEYVQSDGRILPEYQGNYVIALKFGLVPNTLRKSMAARLCKMIEENRDCLDTGFLSVPFLLDVLCENSRRDMAWKLLYQTKCPSWLYMIEHGATTIWESWNCVSPEGTVGAYSYNHYAFGCVGNWMYREIAGIEMLEPGYRRVRICPGTDSGLTWAQYSHRTPYGTLRIRWKRTGTQLLMQGRIPTGTVAEIQMPNGSSYMHGSGAFNITSVLEE